MIKFFKKYKYTSLVVGALVVAVVGGVCGATKTYHSVACASDLVECILQQNSQQITKMISRLEKRTSKGSLYYGRVEPSPKIILMPLLSEL